MSKVKFNEDIMKRLGKHRYVKEINEKQIKFTDEFKSIIVREYEAGKRARQIMEEAQILEARYQKVDIECNGTVHLTVIPGKVKTIKL